MIVGPMDDARLLIEEMGYEVWETSTALLFCDRRISTLWFWRIFLGGWTAGLLFIAPVVGATLALRGDAAGYVILFVGGGLGGIAGLVTLFVHRTFEQRRRAPLTAVRTLASVERASKTLEVDGDTIARLAEVHANVEVALGDSSRGVMRWVVARTRDRRLRLFKTSSRATAQRVVDLLGAYGISEART